MDDLWTTLEWRTVPDKAVALAKSHTAEEIKAAGQDFNALGELGEYLQLFPGKVFGIPNAPSPLTSMLVGGLTGAGLGYGLGHLAGMYMPENWDRTRARKSFATMGGLLGASPGLMWAATNVNSGRPFFSYQTGNDGGTEPFKPTVNVLEGPRVPGMHDEKIAAVVEESFNKLALGMTGLLGVPPINVDEFNETIWRDPRVAGPLTLPQQAAASGLVTGAANMPGKRNTRLVTPMDMGRLALGMGSGYMSGAMVGRILGIALGMPQESQERLRQTGALAGIIANALPLVYG